MKQSSLYKKSRQDHYYYRDVLSPERPHVHEKSIKACFMKLHLLPVHQAEITVTFIRSGPPCKIHYCIIAICRKVRANKHATRQKINSPSWRQLLRTCVSTVRASGCGEWQTCLFLPISLSQLRFHLLKWMQKYAPESGVYRRRATSEWVNYTE